MSTIDHIGSVFLRQILLRMKDLGVNQTQLAKRMKVSRPYVTKVLRGDVNISFVTAAKFAHALQLDFIPVLKDNGESSEMVGSPVLDLTREKRHSAASLNEG